MITDITLRWVVTALFAVSAVHCVRGLAHRTASLSDRIGNGIHLIMSLAMLVMAWPFSMSWPTVAPMVFFLVAALWFVAMLFVSNPAPSYRLSTGYHAVMMLAMAFMYAVMTKDLLPAPKTRRFAHAGHGGMADMPGMDMAGMDTANDANGTVEHTGGFDWTYAGIVACVVLFAVATLLWLYRYFARQRTTEGAPCGHGWLCEVLMAAGMAAMFAVML